MLLINTFIKKIKFFKTGSERSIRAKKNIVVSFGIKGISIIVGLIYVPVLLDFLDQERYGIWLTLASIINWISFFDLGLGNGLRNNLVESFADKNVHLSKSLISTSYAILCIIFISLIIIFFFINPFLDWNTLLNTDSIGSQELSILALVVFTMFCLRLILKLIGTILLADQRPAISNSFETIANIIALITIYFLIKVSVKGSLIILGTVLSLKPILVLFTASIIFFKGKFRAIRPSIKYVNFKYANSIMSLGVKFFFLQFAGLIIFTSSNFIIAQVLGPEEVTPFDVSKKYFSISFMFYAIIMSPIWSAVTDAYYKNDFKWLRNTLKKLHYISAVFVVCIIVMYFASDIIYSIWFGDRLKISHDISFSMAVFSIINVVVSPYSHFINGFGKLQLGMVIVVFKIIVFIPLAIYITKLIDSASGAMFAICGINTISLFIEPVQVYKILNKKASGIWNK